MQIRFWILILAFYGTPFFASNGQTFSERSEELGIEHFHRDPESMGGGVAIFDCNNDGYEDLYLTGGNLPDQLYINMSGKGFSPIAGIGLSVLDTMHTMGVVIGDIDNDSFDDIMVLCGAHLHPSGNILLRNNGDFSFTDITNSAGLDDDIAWSISGTFADFDLDGDLDLYYGNYLESGGAIFDDNDEVIGFDYEAFENKLYINNGDLTFTESAQSAGVADDGCALAVASTDFDMDHDLDLYIANDFGFWNPANALYQNNLQQGFLDVSVSSGTNAEMFGMGIAAGDYDEDGDFDYYVTNIGPNVLFNNQGDGSFEEVAESANVLSAYSEDLFSVSWGTAFVDFDNDTWLDLFVSNGFIPTAPFIGANPIDPNKLYRNLGDGTFTNIAAEAMVDFDGKSRGMAYGDFDLDGDMDMVVPTVSANSLDSSGVKIYYNELDNDYNWLIIRAQGLTSNRNGYGAKVVVEADGRSFLREIDGGSSHCSHNSSIAHFGLGEIEAVDNVRIIWPGGMTQTLGPLEINQYHTIVESNNDPTPIDHVDSAFPIHVPNPLPDLWLLPSIPGRLMIHDSTGRLIWQDKQPHAKDRSIDTKSWAPGSYIISLHTDKDQFTHKAIRP